ncbi:hypothetical protein PFNF135_06282 [Plasmodium falciparum NF135/5.C10]|uniref:Erythrocyte membrane protein 1 n=1 Tax=Plasmodium falciparum NF135/5.C10 TaxID=1036726 RepID=W4I6I2_PLAFA|nr:hypothetical protein PFNF135_06282 [Plasmodium falciparum NF135/5.C10]
MAARKPTESQYKNVNNVKELFDLIGKYIKEKVHSEALDHSKSELHGFLSKVVFSGGEKTKVFKECDIDKEFETNVTDGNSDPCGNRPNVRFSDTEGAECDYRKIKGNKNNSEGGACAPYRRLHLCDQNLEHIDAGKIKNTHSLYVDVLLAAKHEGQMIANKLQEYDATNYESRICTELARSFADIGDIIRGKDLYLGNKKRNEILREKQKLEIKLKSFFEQIYNSLEEKEKKHYGGDENYFQLREDWWDLNRHDVWKAITCSAPNEAKYKVIGADGRVTESTWKKCRNVADVTTYFDYVPQYLRWFEEWAEDFCRKKKKYVDIVKTYCRGVYNKEPRYCSRNGYDCTQTIRAIGKLVIDKGCINCLYACNGYQKWIDNKKKEFLKQKEKYAKEISNSVRKKRSINNYKGYDRKFYDELQNEYGGVNKFLILLNNETECKRITNKEEGIINFNEAHEVKGTFYRSDYCEPCPLCGVKCEGGTCTPHREDEECPSIYQIYEPKPDDPSTDITILKSGEGHDDINKKLDAFCKNSNDNSLYEKWKCYYRNAQNEACILENKNKNKSKDQPDKIQKSYNNFFLFWVAHMLKDSIYWKKKLDKCINNTNGKTMKCRNGCNNDCECFKKWVAQKKEIEWGKIKEHFNKQEDIPEGTHDITLEGVLELQFLNENTEEKSKNSLDSEEIQHLKQIKKLLDKEENQEAGVVSGTGKRTIMDKLIEHEEKEAEKCKETHTNPCPPKPASPAGGGGAGRSETPSRGPTDDHSENEHSEEAEEEEDEEEEEEEEPAEKTAEDEEEENVNQEVPGPTATDTSVDVCKIVGDALKLDNLTDACKLKYKYGKEKFPNWKCIPSDTKSVATGSESEPKRQRREASGEPTGSGNDGAICVPPRRRKLYVTPLTRLAGGDGNTQAGETTQGETSSQSEKLRDAFIESAAIETFFLWHRYKKQKEKPQGVGNVDDEENPDTDPETSLKKGKIPEVFLRQMFYTLADYKDILFSGSKDAKNGYSDIFSGDKEMADRERKIKDAIDKVFPNSVSTPPTTGQPNSDKTPQQTWWEQNGEHIWNGMICALTYKDNSESGAKGSYAKTISQDDNLKGALLDTDGKKPKDTYKYTDVKLNENSGTEAKLPHASTSGEKTYLSKFVVRPPYFRYLEEWGETFCRQRAGMLEQIKVECKVNEDDRRVGQKKPKCSCYGEHCEHQLGEDPTNVSDLKCPGCGRECRKYKKWIEKKKTEYEKQSNAYTEQKNNYVNGSNKGGGIGFCGKLEKDAAEFLQKLGPCSKTNNENKKDNEEDKLDFTKPEETFKPATNCKPCSKFKIKCENSKCNNSEGNTCQTKNSISAENIETMGTPTYDVSMLVSDNSTTEFKGNGLQQACGSAGIFEDIREDVWTCGNVCGYNVCKPKNVNGKQNDKNQIIIIRALFKIWLEYFLKDYNKIRTKLKPCMNNSDGSTCQNKCQERCNCVKAWIEEKRKEWEKIKKHYKTQNEDGDNNMTSLVRNFLEELQPQTDVNKAIKPCPNLGQFENSIHCNGSASSGNTKEDEKEDIVLCLLKKLEKKIGECTSQSSGSPEANCGESSPLPDDDEDLLLEEEENQVGKQHPSFCPPQTPPEPEEPGETCDAPDAPQTDVKKEEEEKEVAKDKAQPGEPAPGPLPPPAAPPSPLPPQADEAFDSTILQTTIPLGIALALGSIAFLFLKKKTKASVGNLFQILQIPKSDYDIPTLKSKNRYIPYRSDTYKGKTYIYMEGDSSGEEKYAFMSDTTDVTSSESEYEEMDINDIYAPRAPKYKTLIEVVLEPSGNNTTASGNNTTASGNNTTASGNNTTASGNNTTASDTQNDIQNDDIPMNKFTDEEWNTLKHEFISQYLQSEQPKDVPNDYKSGDIPFNTQPNTLYFDKPDEKPFITSIHDRNLYSGEEYSYDINMVNTMDDIPINRDNNPYSGIDLINDTLSGNKHIDIYDELLKRKENELFGTNYKKNTSNNSVAKNTNSDSIMNQLDLFHRWLDRHRDMCEKLKNDNERLAKDLEKYNEPYYDVQDDIYYDVNDDKASEDHINMDHNKMDNNNSDVPTNVQIEMNVINNQELLQNEYPISHM